MIYHLTRLEADYGQHKEFIIVAPSESAARDMARGDELTDSQDWLDPALTTCIMLSETACDTAPRVVVAHFLM